MFDQLYLQLNPELRLDQQFATAAVVSAVALGVAGDLLFRGAGFGISVALWSGLLTLGIFAVSRAGAREWPAGRASLLILATLLTAAAGLRASPVLQLLNVGGAAALFGIAVALPPGLGVRRLGFVVFVLAIGLAVFAVVLGALRFLPSQGAMAKMSERFGPRVSLAGRTAALATPLLLLFGGLFVAADAVFESLAIGLLRIDFKEAAGHLTWAVAFSWISLGAIWSNLAMERYEFSELTLADEKKLRSVEVGSILGALAVLFGAFVIVQVRYLFGGHELVERTLGLTYADYARRGFFELVAVAALLLPVLLVMEWARRRSKGSDRTYRILALALVGLLFVVMLSAAERLRIYQATYGLTELRLYSLAFLALLASIFAWFLATVLRGQGAVFLTGGIALTGLAIVGLTVWNPDSFIARVNIDRGAEGESFDAEYLTSLSADAVPAIVSRFDSIPVADRCLVGRRLIEVWVGRDESWRSWNLGRSRATRIVEGEQDRLEAACGRQGMGWLPRAGALRLAAS